jgi:hypothetical protein
VDDAFRFNADLWEYQGPAAWFFVTLPTDIADEIADVAPSRPGFGSVKVDVNVGTTTWSTSLFPDKAAGSYVLPVKGAVRDKESMSVGDTIAVTITLR